MTPPPRLGADDDRFDIERAAATGRRLRSPLRRPAVHCAFDRIAAVGVDREQIVPAMSRLWYTAAMVIPADSRCVRRQ